MSSDSNQTKCLPDRHGSSTTAVALRCLLLLLAPMLVGCASISVDREGRRHVVGLLWMTLPTSCQLDVGAETVRARSLGLTLANSPAQATFAIGYSDIEFSVIRNDAWVLLRAPASKVEPTPGVEPP